MDSPHGDTAWRRLTPWELQESQGPVETRRLVWREPFVVVDVRFRTANDGIDRLFNSLQMNFNGSFFCRNLHPEEFTAQSTALLVVLSQQQKNGAVN
jgi:hypothetical protein